MKTSRFILSRVLRLGAVLLGVVVLTFCMVRMIPGDPARVIAGAQADQQAVEQVRAQFGLDQPVVVQFLNYIGGIFQGDLGVSFKTQQPVAEVIAQNLGPTLSLAAAAIVFIAIFGVGFGLIAGILTSRKQSAEPWFSAISGGLASIPHFLLATFLVFLFAVTWQLFPVAGADSFSALVLPAIAIGLQPAMRMARVIRVRALEVLEQPYVRTVQSKRLAESRIYLRHVLPNTLPAALAIGGALFASLIGGAVVVETVFARPGLGGALVQAVITGDYPVVQGLTLTLGAGVVLANLIVDVLQAVFDPQAKGKE